MDRRGTRRGPGALGRLRGGLGLILAIFLLSRAAFSTNVLESPPIDKVVVVVVDTLRADHLGSYGYGRDTSPVMDRLAAEGVLFERAVAPSSYTRESVAALFTGLYPSRNAWGMGWEATPGPDATTLAGLFQEAGYNTAQFSGTPMLEGLNFQQGFDTVDCLVRQYGVSGADHKVVESALRWMGRHTGDAFFTYIHLLDPHAPYAPPLAELKRFRAPLDTPLPLYEAVRQHVPELAASGFGPGDPRFEDLVARYDAEIAVVDQVIGKLMTGLRALGLDQRTLVILTADHGEEFLEHGFVEHAWRLYRESVHIPMIFWAPSVLRPARAPDAVSLVDLLPTLVSTQGLSVPEALSGRSLFQRDPAGHWDYQTATAAVYSELNIQSRNLVQAVHLGDWSHFEARRWMTPAELSETARVHKEILRQLREGERKVLDPWGDAVYSETAAWNGNENGEAAPEPLRDNLEKLLQAYLAGHVVPVSEDVKREVFGGMSGEDEKKLEALGYLDSGND